MVGLGWFSALVGSRLCVWWALVDCFVWSRFAGLVGWWLVVGGVGVSFCMGACFALPRNLVCGFGFCFAFLFLFLFLFGVFGAQCMAARAHEGGSFAAFMYAMGPYPLA